MSSEREIRTISSALRAVSRNGKRTLTGRAASFGNFSHDLGGFREVIARNAFNSALRRGDETIFCMNHDPNKIMARTRNGSLRLKQSSGGLDFEADLPPTTAGDDLWKLVQAGLISECSFAFKCLQDSWPTARELQQRFPEISSMPNDGLPIRVLEDLTLYDCSAVAQPAYPTGTHVGGNFNEVSSLALAEARSRGGQPFSYATASEVTIRARARQIGEQIRQSENLLGHHDVEMARIELERIERLVK
jgi:HK97 family phage prohead protease